MDASRDRDSAARTREQIDHVVALLKVMYQANGRLAAELDRLASSRASVSDASVTGLLRLADDLRPGAAARAHLAELDRDVQVAGAAEWIARRRRLEPDAELVPTVRPGEATANPHKVMLGEPQRETSAAERAHTRWHNAQGEPR
jgi:hypothetical protein